ESAVFTAQYIVSEQDIVNGTNIVNTATAHAVSLTGVLNEPSATEEVTVGQQVIAVSDFSFNHAIGSSVTIQIIANDTLSNGLSPVPAEVDIDLDLSANGIQTSLTVIGEGTYVYNPLTGEVQFTPETTF